MIEKIATENLSFTTLMFMFSRRNDRTYLQYCCTQEDEHTLPYRQLILRSPSLHLQFLEIFARKNDTSTPYLVNVILLQL